MLNVALPKGRLGEKVYAMFASATYYSSIGRDIDIIHLNGSIELAPVLGMSDVIVDIVETGTTLKENGLEVIETIMPISARVIVNKASFEFKKNDIIKVINSLEKQVEENNK